MLFRTIKIKIRPAENAGGLCSQRLLQRHVDRLQAFLD
jgi:hypothetical protein